MHGSLEVAIEIAHLVLPSARTHRRANTAQEELGRHRPPKDDDVGALEETPSNGGLVEQSDFGQKEHRDVRPRLLRLERSEQRRGAGGRERFVGDHGCPGSRGEAREQRRQVGAHLGLQAVFDDPLAKHLGVSTCRR
ncbi:MAG TPA: hypothetical protein VLM85_25505 [Polyangiaceae bacterium]|nr:hypothetical protein [Polyangiaceae bacterium]